MTDTVLFAAGDPVLREALSFALEHEGFVVKTAADLSRLAANEDARSADCLVIDHGAFASALAGDRGWDSDLGIPVILICHSRTARLMDQARVAGVTSVVEMPLLDGILCEEIRKSLKRRPARAEQP